VSERVVELVVDNVGERNYIPPTNRDGPGHSHRRLADFAEFIPHGHHTHVFAGLCYQLK
jgi:hypothetical protein